MAGEPAADCQHLPADCAGGTDASTVAAAEALLSAASEQLTLVYHGEVYVFDRVPTPKVEPFCTLPNSIANVRFFPFVLIPVLTSSGGHCSCWAGDILLLAGRWAFNCILEICLLFVIFALGRDVFEKLH